MPVAAHRAAFALIAALVLAGCVPGGPEPTATPSPTPEATTASAVESPDPTQAPEPSPAATPTPGDSPTPAEPEPAEPSPDESSPASTASPAPRAAGDDCPTYDDGLDWDYVPVDGNRFSSVCVGMTFEEASDSIPGLTIESDPRCPWVAPIVDEDPLYITAISDPSDPSGPIRMFRMLYLADPVTAPPDETPATAEAVAIGSPLAAVLDAYPRARQLTVEDPSRGPREQVLVEDDTSLWYVFDIVDGVVAELTWGRGLGAGIAGEMCAL